MFSKFFIHRPIFAGVISIVIVVAGLVTLKALPIAQYPPITPPTVQVSTAYPGASPAVLAETVAAPIEQQVNGVEGMLYMSSVSSADGSYSLTVTFEVGTDVDMAQVLVQNRVAIALPTLPDEVKQLGVTTEKKSTDIVMMITLTSPDDRFSGLFLSNYSTLNIRDELARLPGAGDIFLFGAGDYSMRFWLDMEKLKVRGLTTQDVFNAISEQNIQVAAGVVGQPPAPEGQVFQYTVNTLGRLSDVKEFENIIIRADGNRITRMKDVARVELGAQSYSISSSLAGRDTAIIVVYQQPGANALDLAQAVYDKMDELSRQFPEGMEYSIPFDTTLFVKASIDEVMITLVIAVVLVFLTIFLFLQDWRASMIPGATIPVSLIGTFAVMGMMGFSLNLLTLFGLVLAIGIVVDDAIVVVENTTRNMENGLDRREATAKAMQEVTGPIVATTLVLLAVFVPTAFQEGISGQMFRQFALTIAVSTVFSSINALTLAPALSAILLKLPAPGAKKNFIFRGFEWGFEKTKKGYERLIIKVLRVTAVVFVLYVGLTVLMFWGFTSLPTGFVPNEDQGYAMYSVQLPDASSLQRTQEVIAQLDGILKDIPGVETWLSVPGFSLLDGANISNFAAVWVVFKPWAERGVDEGVQAILGQMRAKAAKIESARLLPFEPPPIQGLGNAGGFQMELQDRGGVGLQALQAVAENVVRNANTQTRIGGAFTTFRANVPQLYADIDRTKVKSLGISLPLVFGTLQSAMGSAYVNDFNLLGRTYQVNIQAEKEFRATPWDIGQLAVKNAAGDVVPLSTLLDTKWVLGPQVVNRYNLFPSASILGAPAPGVSSGEALAIMEQLAEATMPASMGYSWTGVSFQEKAAGSGALIFGLAILFAYLFLCAQYESWSIPVAVMLSVPLALVGAVGAVAVRGMDINLYTQIGVVLLIGLAAKNAILIVEFAKELMEKEGLGVVEAAQQAAILRFRPVLMTAVSFILGVAPLVVATGAGANSRQAVGTVVFGGMLASTVFTVIFVPTCFVIMRKIFRGKKDATPHREG